MGEIGAAIGKVLGKIVAWAVDELVKWIISLFKDDIFAPGTTLAALGMAAGTAYVNSPGSSDLFVLRTPVQFRGHGGEYIVKGRWRVEVPGLLGPGSLPAAPRKFVGVFRAETDPYALWVGDWKSFQSKWQELSGAGLRLVDLDTYLDGGERYWAGVYLRRDGTRMPCGSAPSGRISRPSGRS